MGSPALARPGSKSPGCQITRLSVKFLKMHGPTGFVANHTRPLTFTPE